MLDSQTMKAIIEGMLFVSEKPVTLRQMIARLRTASKDKDPSPAAAESGLALPPGGEGLGEGSPNLNEGESFLSDELMTEDAANEDDAIRAQLMQKQKELEEEITAETVKPLLFAIEAELQNVDRGIELVQVAKGYQLRTKEIISNYLRDDKPVTPSRLSPSSLETLAIVAYEQPVNRNKIEDIRGVDCGGVLKTLLDKDFVRMIGRSDEPGRPLVYGTTTKFLEVFGLGSLKDLPSPGDFQDLSLQEDAGVNIVAEGEEDAETPHYLSYTDFDDGDATMLSEAERALLEELDSSLLNLKDVEKGIVMDEDAKEENNPEVL